MIPGGTGANFSFTPSDNGTYWIGFNVSDDSYGTGMDMVTITVNNVAPPVSVGGAEGIDEGTTYTLNLSTGDDPGDDTISGWFINWGDETMPDYYWGNLSSVTHEYRGPGERT